VKIVPGIIPVIIVPEIIPVVIIPVVIVSAVIGKGMRRYNPGRCDYGRPSPESRHPGVVPAVISIHPGVTGSRTGGPHHRQRRGGAETDTY
jgi:hypothetical protein